MNNWRRRPETLEVMDKCSKTKGVNSNECLEILVIRMASMK